MPRRYILRIGQTPPSQPTPPDSVDVEAFRFDGTTGSVLVSSGFPLKPGMLFSDTLDQFRVFINNGTSNVEQAIAVTALRGRPFPDGSLRSVGVQFQYTLAHGVPVTGFVAIDANGRGTTDISWTEPTYSGAVANRAVLLPTSAQYKCDTNVVLTPLQPESLDSAIPAAFFGTATSQELGAWATELSGPSANSNLGDPLPGATTYEHVQGLFAAWARSEGAASRQYYQWAYERLYDQMQGEVGVANRGYWLPSEAYNSTAYNRITAPEGLTPLSGSSNQKGDGSEKHSGQTVGWAVGYLLTGWLQPWRKLCQQQNQALAFSSTFAGAQTTFLPTGTACSMRVGCQLKAQQAMAAYVVDATMQVPGSYGGGRSTSRSWVTEMPWIPDAWEALEFTGGAYTDGLVGQRPTVTCNCLHSPHVAGHFPTFQLFTWTRAALFYYNNIHPDSRIVTWLQTAADFVIDQIFAANNRWYLAYEHRVPPITSQPHADPWYIPFFTELFGAVYALTGNATYKTWCGNAMQVTNFNKPGSGNFTRTWKAFGEYFAGHLQSAAYYYDGGAVRGITGAHPDTITEPTVYTS